MSGQTQKWQHVDTRGRPTPYYVPPGSPRATPVLTNNMIFPRQGDHMTPTERLASMHPAKAQAEEQSCNDNEEREQEPANTAVKFALTEAELQAQDAEDFMEEPPVGLSPSQQACWGELYSALFADNEPGELDPLHKRARGELLKLQSLADMASKMTVRGQEDKQAWARLIGL